MFITKIIFNNDYVAALINAILNYTTDHHENDEKYGQPLRSMTTFIPAALIISTYTKLTFLSSSISLENTAIFSFFLQGINHIDGLLVNVVQLLLLVGMGLMSHKVAQVGRSQRVAVGLPARLPPAGATLCQVLHECRGKQADIVQPRQRQGSG